MRVRPGEIVRQVQSRGVAKLELESRQDDRDDERVIMRTREREPSLVFEHQIARHESETATSMRRRCRIGKSVAAPSVRLSVRLFSRLGGWLRQDLGCVPALGGLLRDAEHRSDLGPGSISVAGIADGIEQRRVDVGSLLREFGNGP
jgi:hypothetical protein